VAGLFGFKSLTPLHPDTLEPIKSDDFTVNLIDGRYDFYDYTSLCDYIAWDVCRRRKFEDKTKEIAGYLKILVSEYRKRHTHSQCKAYLWRYHVDAIDLTLA
jgi:hypothetical protein